MFQLDEFGPAAEDADNLGIRKDRPSLFIYDKTSDFDLCDLMETRVVSALFDFLNINENQNVADDVIVEIIDFLKSKYNFTEESATFEDFVELVKFKLHNEATENLVKTIEHFEPSPNQFKTTINDDQKRIIIKYKNRAFPLNKDFFYLKLYQTIDDIYAHPDSYNNIDRNYVWLRDICSKSKLAFQYFYRKTATIMIQHQYPECMQKYLDLLVSDVRLRQHTLDDFYQMYSEDLYFYVNIMNDSDSDSQSPVAASSPIVCNILRNLRCKDLMRFVIVASHFKEYRHLLRTNCE